MVEPTTPVYMWEVWQTRSVLKGLWSNCDRVCMTRQPTKVVLDILVDGGGRHQDMQECSLTAQLFSNSRMCTVLDQFVDSNLIDMHITGNIVSTSVKCVMVQMYNIKTALILLFPARRASQCSHTQRSSAHSSNTYKKFNFHTSCFKQCT
jgi:hypothetical protein